MLLVPALVAVLGLGGCAGDSSAGDTAASDERAPVVVDITIANGQVNPDAADVDVAVGEQVQLRVDSDAVDELHVHSAPEEQEFEVAAAEGQTFEFVAEQPGQFDVELHSSDTLVARLVVRP